MAILDLQGLELPDTSAQPMGSSTSLACSSHSWVGCN
ncbi:SapB/AmfS family lanthipeptide [Streptomyces murinus]|nr:SapB/AmfS family lanthipeptide [Streptomyces murinus]